MRLLPRAFYNRSPLQVAPELLGKILFRQLDGQLLSGRIIEVEAYDGFADAAAHSYKGKTNRNASLFGPPGVAYVHSIHRYHCLDVVTEAEGIPTSVLIRALLPLTGIAHMRQLRQKTSLAELTSGPGKLCQALSIDRTCDGMDLTSPSAQLYIGDDGCIPQDIETSPRIGISKAKELPYRYTILVKDAVT